MNTSLPWDDYRVIRAVAEAGSLAAAGRCVGASHPTILRRLNAIEARLGVRLFERFRTGYVATPAGEELLAAAQVMAELTAEAERKVAGRDLRPSGLVRLTTTDTLLVGLLARPLARFREERPEIDLVVSVSNDVFDLSRREADIAIRPSSSPEPHLVGRRLGPFGWRSTGTRRWPATPGPACSPICLGSAPRRPCATTSSPPG